VAEYGDENSHENYSIARYVSIKESYFSYASMEIKRLISEYGNLKYTH